jgi:beta-glucosidase
LPENASTSDKIRVSVDVENTGKRDGDEVAQLYVKIENAAVPVPLHALQSFKRINLKTGEKKTVTFELEPKQFAIIDDENKRVVQPGNFTIFVGGQQPGKLDKGLNKSLTLSGKQFYIE